MAFSVNSASFGIYSFLFMISAVAQSGNTGSVTGSCNTNVTVSRQYYEIRFRSFCQTKLTNPINPFPAVQKASFQDCSVACVDLGITCGSFAYDRSSHYGQNNCYLSRATSENLATGIESENTWFDSGIVDNSSLPITRRDCGTFSQNRVYLNYDLRCGAGIHDDANGNQLNTVFAASIGDCIDHCNSLRTSNDSYLCQAVTWDPYLVHGYQNCRLKGSGYIEPTDDALWDSGTLIGTQGRVVSNTNTSSSATSATSSSSTGISTNPTPHSGKKLSGSAIGGIVGGITGFIALVGAIVLWRLRRHISRSVAAHGERPAKEGTSTNSSPPDMDLTGVLMGKTAKGKEREVEKETDLYPFSAAELDSIRRAELDGTRRAELDSTRRAELDSTPPESGRVRYA